MFWDSFIQLCQKKGIKPNPLAEELGISSGSLTKWKNGALPTVENLLKIASYFGVSIDYLVSGQNDSCQTDQEFIALFHSLQEETQKKLIAFMQISAELEKMETNNKSGDE